MMAAGRAAERGRSALLLEKNDSLGRKLLISGKGRCNITNIKGVSEHIENFGGTGRFLRNAFSRLFNAELMRFFEERGVELKAERGGRVFPRSDRSKDILEALRRYMRSCGAKVLLRAEADDISIDSRGVKRVVLKDGTRYQGRSMALCTGGLSYPATGSTGFGFEMARELGHNVIPPSPALAALVTESRVPVKWRGISLRNVEASLISGKKRIRKEFGDALFTHFGLSGPVILDLSADAFRALRDGKDAYISINLKPALDKGKLGGRLIREFSSAPNRSLKNALRALLPLKMTDDLIDSCGLKPDAKCNRITKGQRSRIVERLTDLRFKIKSVRPIEEAIVTRGGVDTREIDPRTMESRLIGGLFFAGEIIDVDAGTGGYNMQAAFSTGYVCGDNM